MRSLELVLRQNDDTIAVLKDFPTIPPVGHIFSIKYKGIYRKYGVTQTTSIIDSDNVFKTREKDEDEDTEVIRVDVQPH